MKFSTKSRYALRLMAELARYAPGSTVSLKEISERQQLSLKYLEQIVTPLARVGLVKSERGSHPVLSQFEFGVGGLLSNCAKLAIAHLPSTIALALLLYAALTVCLNFFLAIAVTPALLALLHSLLLERIFAPYLRQQLGEDDNDT